MRLLVLLVITTLPFSAAALDPSTMSPLAAAYYQCMMKQSAHYGKKAENAAEAIVAARSSCQKQREELQIDTFAEIAATEAIAGRTVSEYQINRRANAALDKVDERMRPDWVRSVLEAK